MFSFQTALFPLFVIFIILSVRKSGNDEILSMDDCGHLRGIFAVMIIIFHVSKKTDLLYPVFKYCSVIAVGSFFFISGFGLMKGYLNKRYYEKNYILKRFSRVILPYAIMTFVYWAYDWMIGDRYTLFEVLDRIVHFGPIVMYSWFIVSIIMQYLYFWILMKVCRRNMKMFSVIVWVLLGIKMIMALLFKRDEAAFLDTFFCLGILYAYHEGSVSGIIRNRYKVLVPVSVIVTVLLCMSSLYLNSLLGEALVRIAFIVMICSFLYLYDFENRYLRFLGAISFEIYMTQGISKMIVRRFLDLPLFFQDMAIYLLCFVFSVSFHYLFNRLSFYLARHFGT